MYQFLNVKKIKYAAQMAPWARIFRKHQKGYMAFLDKKSFEHWKKYNKLSAFSKIEILFNSGE